MAEFGSGAKSGTEEETKNETKYHVKMTINYKMLQFSKEISKEYF